eukprot:m.35589 g.35589  ORF g.35589 m.35589 type:complete len:292 (+) comp10935_c0_seq2:253-1128(+)
MAEPPAQPPPSTLLQYGDKPGDPQAQNAGPGYYNRGWNDPPPTVGASASGRSSKRKDQRRKHHAAAAATAMPPPLGTPAAATLAIPPVTVGGLSLEAEAPPPSVSCKAAGTLGSSGTAPEVAPTPIADAPTASQVAAQLDAVLGTYRSHPKATQKQLDDVTKRLGGLSTGLASSTPSLPPPLLINVAAILTALQAGDVDQATAQHVNLVRDHGAAVRTTTQASRGVCILVQRNFGHNGSSSFLVCCTIMYCDCEGCVKHPPTLAHFYLMQAGGWVVGVKRLVHLGRVLGTA